jgi:hypothetical protein
MVLGPQNSYQKWHHICSTVTFVEQNFHFLILSRKCMGGTLRTQNFNILSTPLSSKYKIWCHGSTAAAMPTVMLDDPGSNPGVNHGCLYFLVERTCSV